MFTMNTTTTATTTTTAMISRKRSLLERTYYTDSEKTKPNKKRTMRVVSALPQRMCEKKDNTVKPEDFLLKYLKSQGINASIKRFDEVEDLFEEPQPCEIEAYGFEALDAVRKRDIGKLEEFRKEGRPLKCSNRFGESILHLACRKGFDDVVDFLIKKADVPVWVKDDFGRSPLHDACWTVKPNFEMMDVLIEKSPDLLLVSDARGHTPLAYVRFPDFKKWVDYLTKKGPQLKPKKLFVSTESNDRE